MGPPSLPENPNVIHYPPVIRSLTRFVDDLASREPQRPWFIIPETDNVSGAWRTITLAELVQAVDGLAKWIENTIGLGHEERQSVAYMGVNDQRYLVLMLALVKTNRKAMLLSLRNSAEAQAHLLKATNCTHCLYSEGIDPQMKILRAASDAIPTHQIPTFDEMLAAGRSGQPYEGIRETGMYEEVCILHSSGSTGLPKPIPLTVAWLASFYFQKNVEVPPGRSINLSGLFGNDGEPLLVTAPFFHAMGVAAIFRSIYTGPIVLAPPSRRMDAGLAQETILQRKAGAVILPPSILDDLAATEEGLAAISILNHVTYGGAPLAKEAGDKIVRITSLHNLYGSTEAALCVLMDPISPEYWPWYEWHPATGVVMEDAGAGQFESVIKPSDVYPYQPVFYTFPGLKEWRTKDLWLPHPEKPNLWKYSGRRDDVIVFSNGEKFTPLLYEATVESHPLVRGAIFVGQNRFQPALIIEPQRNEDPDRLLQEIWPTVERANEGAPAFAKVWKNKIAFAKPSKPFPRAGKGSIQRAAAVKQFEPEIEALYSNETFDENLQPLPKEADLDETRAFVRAALQLALSELNEEVSDETNIFDLGVDSLSVLALTSTLTHGLRNAAGEDQKKSVTLTARVVYDNPTIAKLAMKVHSMLHSKDSGLEVRTREDIMADMVKKYTTDMPQGVKSEAFQRGKNEVVILTGSTGSLGTYTLHELISSPGVAKIYCLNRSDAESRQAAAFQNAGLPVDFSKVTFLRTDFARPQFDLPDATYNELLRTATTFIHNAWSVDFNHPLEGFETPHIAGTRRVVDFSLSSRFRPHIIFISSIASVACWPSLGKGPVPEEFIDDDRVSLPQGYGESKHVAGKILAYAARHRDVPVSVVRCGQLAGPRQEQGVWNRHEWLPSLVHTSKVMGVLPGTLGNQDRVDWVPMDATARTVFEIANKPASSPLLDVFHIVNPRVVSWSSLTGTIQKFYAAAPAGGKTIRIVSFSEWVAALKAVPMTKEEVVEKPALKLIDFYESLGEEGGGLPEMSTRHTESVSNCLHELEPVTPGLIENWLKQWKF